MKGLREIVREAHRRSIWQVLGIYLVGAWIGYEVIQALTEGLGLPDWFPALAVILFIIGLPIVLATAFVQEGIPTSAAEPDGAPARATGAAADAARPGTSGTAPATGATGRILTWRNALMGGLLAFAAWGVFAAGWMLYASGERESASAALARSIVPFTDASGLESNPDWSPDGGSVVFVSERSGNHDIWVRSVTGREEIQITTDPSEDTQPAWSPDGRRIAFVSSRGRGPELDRNVLLGFTIGGGGLWMVPALGGEPTRVLDGGFNPDWSPDGDWLVFDGRLDGPHRIWVAMADRPTPRRITHEDSDAIAHTHPKWSPDGRWIVFLRHEGSTSDLLLVPAEGGAAIPLTHDSSRDFAPNWTPDGGAIVFASDRSGTIDLWSLRIDPRTGQPRGAPSQITAGSEQILEPSVAPDGATIAASSVRTVEDLWSVETDPETSSWIGEPAPLLSSSSSDNQPALSPDARHAVFSSDRTGVLDLWIVEIETGALRSLTQGPGRDRQPDWSPDGRQIAFFSDRSGNNEIWVAPASGGPAIQLTDHPADDSNPYWSPDGRQIAFMSDRGGRSEIWVMNADGGSPRQLTDIGASGHTARWSPDGEWILFTSPSGGDRNVWAVRSRGGETRRLTPEPTQEAHGLWTPDGRTVLYLSDHRSLRAVALEGGTPRLIYEAPAGERIDYTHLSRDGRRLLFTFQRAEGDLWLIRGSM